MLERVNSSACLVTLRMVVEVIEVDMAKDHSVGSPLGAKPPIALSSVAEHQSLSNATRDLYGAVFCNFKGSKVDLPEREDIRIRDRVEFESILKLVPDPCLKKILSHKICGTQLNFP